MASRIKIRVREKNHFETRVRTLYHNTDTIIQAMTKVPEKKLTPEEQIQAIYDGTAKMIPHDEATAHYRNHTDYRGNVLVRAVYSFTDIETPEKTRDEIYKPAKRRLEADWDTARDNIFAATHVDELGPALGRFKADTSDIMFDVAAEANWEGDIPDVETARKLLDPRSCY